MLNLESIRPEIKKINKDLISNDRNNSIKNNKNIYIYKNSNNNQELEIKNQNISNSLNNDNLENKSNNYSEQENPEIPPFRRNLIFTVFLLSDLFLNYDTGVIPASLIEITKEIELDYSEQALLGSLVYLGLSSSSIFVSLFFSNFSPSKVCSIILIFNCLSCFILSYSLNKNISTNPWICIANLHVNKLPNRLITIEVIKYPKKTPITLQLCKIPIHVALCSKGE